MTRGEVTFRRENSRPMKRPRARCIVTIFCGVCCTVSIVCGKGLDVALIRVPFRRALLFGRRDLRFLSLIMNDPPGPYRALVGC